MTMPLKRRMRLLSQLAVLIALCGLAGTAAAGGDPERIAADLKRSLAQLDSLNRSLYRVMVGSDSLANEMKGIRSDDGLNIFERRRLESGLRQSQALSERQDGMLAEQNRLLTLTRNLSARLDSLISARLDSLIQRLEAAGSGDEKTALVDQIRRLTGMQRRWRIDLRARSQQVFDPGPSVELDDMPRDIEAKADFYRDREEIYRQKADELRQRLDKARIETRLRGRLAEMVDDVRLFDQRDESGIEAREAVTGTDPQNRDYLWSESDKMAGISNTLAIRRADRLLDIDLHLLPDYDIETYLLQLQVELDDLLAAADSLAKIVRACELQAIRLRESLKR